MNIYKNDPVSVTNLAPSLRVGFISSQLTADKLFAEFVPEITDGSTEDEPPA